MRKRFIFFIHSPEKNAKVGIGFSITRISINGFLEIIRGLFFITFFIRQNAFQIQRRRVLSFMRQYLVRVGGRFIIQPQTFLGVTCVFQTLQIILCCVGHGLDHFPRFGKFLWIQ